MKNLILAAILVVPLAGCDIQALADPARAAQVEANDAELEALSVELETAEADAKAALEALTTLQDHVEGLTLEQIQEKASILTADFEEKREAYRITVEAYNAKAEEQGQLVKDIFDDAAAPFIPFLPPGLPQLAPSVALLVFPRWRKYLFKSAKNMVNLNVGTVVSDLAKLIGAFHSEPEDQPGYQGPGDIVPPQAPVE